MLDEEKGKNFADGFDAILSLQRKFQKEHGFEFWKESHEKRREMFIRTLFAAIGELIEAGDEVNKWWKKGCKEPESLIDKKDTILEEIIDSFHFYLCALLILEVDGEKFIDTYMKKLKVNYDRQQDEKHGYI